MSVAGIVALFLFSICMGLRPVPLWSDGASGSRMQTTEAERSAEVSRLASYGVHADPVLQSPYALPLQLRSYVVPPSWFDSALAQDHSKIKASELRADLPILRVAMQDAYSGWETDQRAGWNWSRWFKNWDGVLKRAGDQELTFEAATEPFKQLEQLRIDNHSGFIGKGCTRYSSLSRCAVLSRAPKGPCTEVRNSNGLSWPLDPHDAGQQPHSALAADAKTPLWYISYPDAWGEVTAVQCGDTWIASQPDQEPSDQDRLSSIETLAGTKEDIPVRREIAPGITYYRLPTFDDRNDEALRMLLSAQKPSIHQDKLTVVDLRANDGGDAPVDDIAFWTDTPVLDIAGAGRRHFRSSTLYSALCWNAENMELSGVKPPISDDLRNSVQARLDGLTDPNAAKAAQSLYPTGHWTYAEHHLPAKPKLLILVDNRCASDGEAMTYILAAADGAVVAGVNTAGVAQHIVPGYMVLPHTHMVFRMSLGLSDLYGDNRSVDGYGLDVDILLPTPGANSAANITQLAKRLAGD